MSFSTDKIRSLLSSTSAPQPSNSVNVSAPLPPSASSTASFASSYTSSTAAIPLTPDASNVPPHLSTAVEALLRTYELDAEFSALDQVDMCVEAALQCARAGSMRKFGFFLVQAAGLYQELDKAEACTAILQSIQPLYKLHPVMAEATEAERLTAQREAQRLLAMSPERRQERGVTHQRWLTLQKSILEHLIYVTHKKNSQQPRLFSPYQPHLPAPLATAEPSIPLYQTCCCAPAVCCTCCPRCTLTWTCSTSRA